MRSKSSSVRTLNKKQTVTSLALVMPAFLLYAVIVLIPVLNTIRLSFFKWNGLSPTKAFVGFKNYMTAFQDQYFGAAFVNNLIWLALFVTIPIIIALFLSLAVTNDSIRGRDKFQAIFFIPYVLSHVVIALIWKLIYSPNIGILSWILQALNIVDKPFGILGSSSLALFGLIFVQIWNQFGFCTVIYINALQNIDPELYDAADIDGANPVQRLFNVTLPGISTVTTFLVLMNMIASFKTFNFVFLMTMGGPVQRTEVVSYRVYIEAFQLHKVGYGSTLAVILSVIVVLFGMYYVSLREKKQMES